MFGGWLNLILDKSLSTTLLSEFILESTILPPTSIMFPSINVLESLQEEKRKTLESLLIIVTLCSAED